MSTRIYFITHPDVVVDPSIPVPRWPLSERGRERMRSLLGCPWIREISAIFCSTEQKAIDGAAILAEHLGISYETVEPLGENDRSTTGYMPRDEFRKIVEEFFAHPHESVRGWERAVDAQARIVKAVNDVAARADKATIAIVAHGGVGTLLLCHVKGVPISPTEEQPGTTGGNYFVFDCDPTKLIHGWEPIDAS